MTGDDNTAVSPDDVEEVVITDQDLYQHAISDEPEKPAESSAPTESAPEQPQVQGRDDKGRFAQKAPPQAAPQPRPVQAAPQPRPQQPQPQADHRVPLRELLDERDRRQKLETQVQQLEQAFNYLRQNGMPQRQQPQQQLNPQQLFEQPDQYLNQAVVSPLRNELEALRYEGHMAILQRNDAISRDYANDKYGAKAVDAALEAMKQVRYTPQGDFAYRQIMQSGNPYKSLVEWHKKDRAIQAIGHDPDAWLRQKQEQWLDDPNAQKAMVERLRRQQQKSPAASSPNVSLPPSLSSIPATSGRVSDEGDLSDESLFRHAMR